MSSMNINAKSSNFHDFLLTNYGKFRKYRTFTHE